MGQDWDVFLDAIEVFGGAYLIFIGIDMKRTGILTQYSLLGRNVILEQAPDIPGFIRSMYLKYIICGAVFLIPSVLSLYLNSRGLMSTEIFYILTGVLAVDLITFATFLLDAQKKYLIP